MKRSKLLASALLVVLPFLLTACTLRDLPVIGKYLPDWPGGKGGGSDFPTQEVTLNVWGLWENSEVIDALAQKYQEIHPNVKINYEDRSILKPADYKESVYTRLTQENSSAGDIVFVHNSWVPAIKDNLEPAPDSLMTADKFNSSFYPVASQSAVFSGKVYAMPLYYDGLALVYNKKHFADINQSAPPASWEEFRRLALELTIRGSGGLVRGGAAIGGVTNIEFAGDIIGLLFSQANLSIPGDLDEKAAQDAMSFYTNFLLVDKVWDEKLPEASAAFTQEKASMIFVPSWNLLDILDARPDWALNGNIGVAPVPQALVDEPVNWASFWMATVPAKSPNKQVAWDFVNFITEEAQQKIWFDEASKTRAFGPIYSRSTLAGDLASNPFLAPYTQEALTARSGILVSRAGNKTANEAIADAISSMIGGSRSNAISVLKNVQEKLLGTH